MNKYQKYLGLQLIVVVLVIIFFRTLESKKIAAVINSLLFLCSTSYVLWSEREFRIKSLSGVSAGIFLVLGVLPVMLVRFINWDSDFATVVIFGHFSGSDLHRFSNYPFIFMLVCFFIESYRYKLRKRSHKQQALE